MTVKDTKQKEFVEAFLSLSSRRGTIIAATGIGKSKITIDILEAIEKDYDEIMLVVNADRLRDVTWKQEFKKWGKHKLLEKVDLRNYQTVHRWDPKEVPLENTFIVYDEIDFAIGTPEYSKIFYNYSNHPSLGLTGYCAKHKREELNNILPVIVEYTFEQAVEDKVINDIRFHLLKFDLDRDPKGIKVTYKKEGEEKSFYQSENSAYDYADRKFRIAYGAYEKGLIDYSMGIINERELKKLEYISNAARDARLKLLYNNISSRNYTKKLQQAILDKDINNKVIVFSRYIEQADTINNHTYHSKNSKEKNEKNFDSFNSGKIRSMSVCSKIDRGDNIVGLNNIILESYTSSDTIIRQRIGRSNRLDVDDIANIFILLPYFMRKNADGTYTQAATQAVKWADTMLMEYDLSRAKIYDYRSIKSNL